MEKERSKGVTVWAWIFIISASIGLLSVINAKQRMQTHGIGMLFFGIAVSLAYLICGIHLLKLNNNARKAAIILSFISIIACPFYLKLAFKQMSFNAQLDESYSRKKQAIIEQTKPELQQKKLETLEKARGIAKNIPIFIMVTVGLSYVIYYLLPIYFFTRPKVKEQFR